MSDVSAISSGALSIATSAIKKSQQNLDKDASVVASSSVESTDTMTALVDSRQQVLYSKAAATLISVGNEMVSSLLDVHA